MVSFYFISKLCIQFNLVLLYTAAATLETKLFMNPVLTVLAKHLPRVLGSVRNKIPLLIHCIHMFAL